MPSTSAKCGYTGTTSIGTEVVDFNINLLQDVVEATSLASNGNKESIACLKSAEGDFTTLVPSGTVGSRLGVAFSTSYETIVFDLLINNIVVSGPVDGRASYKYSFVSTGEVVIS